MWMAVALFYTGFPGFLSGGLMASLYLFTVSIQ
jgi:hypothetical protein